MASMEVQASLGRQEQWGRPALQENKENPAWQVSPVPQGSVEIQAPPELLPQSQDPRVPLEQQEHLPQSPDPQVLLEQQEHLPPSQGQQVVPEQQEQLQQ